MISIAEGQSSPNATVHLFTPASDHVAEVEQTIMGVTGADLLVSHASTLDCLIEHTS